MQLLVNPFLTLPYSPPHSPPCFPSHSPCSSPHSPYRSEELRMCSNIGDQSSNNKSMKILFRKLKTLLRLSCGDITIVSPTHIGHPNYTCCVVYSTLIPIHIGPSLG